MFNNNDIFIRFGKCNGNLYLVVSGHLQWLVVVVVKSLVYLQDKTSRITWKV